jgi:peptide/nickel transport system permease protein
MSTALVANNLPIPSALGSLDAYVSNVHQIPVLTLAGINLVLMINVAVVVETVFAWPGVGRLLYEGISFRDFPVVQGVVIMGGTMIVAVNLLVDVVYAVIDPRIRLEK